MTGDPLLPSSQNGADARRIAQRRSAENLVRYSSREALRTTVTKLPLEVQARLTELHQSQA
ncbi:MAG: hypothetical protein PVH11_02660 [Anaerolineae bacterium]